MKAQSILNRILAIFVALIIYACGLFVGVGVFSIMNQNMVFSAAGSMRIYFYLGIGIVGALAVIAALSLSFRNISLLKMFPALVGPACYIGLFFYFQVYDLATIYPLVNMFIYCFYILIRGSICLENISAPDHKVTYLMERHPRSYIVIYLGLGIIIPSYFAFFSYIPLMYYLQNVFTIYSQGGTDFGNSVGYIIALSVMLLAIILACLVDIPLFVHKLRKGDEVLYEGKCWPWKVSRHPNIYLDMVFVLMASIYIFHFDNMYAYIRSPIALYAYVFLVIFPLCRKADSAYIKGYREKWERKK